MIAIAEGRSEYVKEIDGNLPKSSHRIEVARAATDDPAVSSYTAKPDFGQIAAHLSDKPTRRPNRTRPLARNAPEPDDLAAWAQDAPADDGWASERPIDPREPEAN